MLKKQNKKHKYCGFYLSPTCNWSLTDSYIFYLPHKVLKQWNNITVMSLMILPSFEYTGVNISGVLSKFSICSLVRQKNHQTPKTKLKMHWEDNAKERHRLFYFKLANSTAAFLQHHAERAAKTRELQGNLHSTNIMLSEFYKHLFILNLVLFTA